MAFTAIPDSDVDPESPVTTGLMTALRNNASFGSLRVQVFTANGTFTVPSGVTRVKAIVTAGGGGGGGGDESSNRSAAGGGAGATAISYMDVTPGDNMSVTVGSGGSAGSGGTSPNNGGNGGDSSFNGVTAGKGFGAGRKSGGTHSFDEVVGGEGGTVTAGSPDISIPGGDGQSGQLNLANSIGGNGGSSYWGGGGLAGFGIDAAGSGSAPGSGGGGGDESDSDGGAGADGIVVIEY